MKYSIDLIKKFGTDVFEKAGLTREDAEICMESFILSDMRGVKSHGITHLKGYCDRIVLGTSSTASELSIVETSPSTLMVDAGHAVGMSAGIKVMEACVKNAAKAGSCFAAVKNGCHYGFGGFFAMYAADRNMIGFCIANTPPLVVPFGGAKAMLGTNPLSIAIPAGKYPALVLDMATSIVAKGKISLALKENKSIPDTWAVDKDGNPTTDPAAANIGALLPFGGAKGYAIALIIDVLCSALPGADNCRNIPRFWEEPDKMTNIGYLMGAIDISKFVDPKVFRQRADGIFDEMKASPPAPGFKEVMIPGEIEYNLTQQSLAEGVDVSEATLAEFKALAERYRVEYPF